MQEKGLSSYTWKIIRNCFYSALSGQTDVTRTCFTDLGNPNTRTVERVEEMFLSEAHEGLEPGQSVQHIGMFKDAKACGFFHEVKSNFNLGDNPVCLLTSLKPRDTVSQVCFDPSHPESVVLKPMQGISLSHPGDEPVSIVIEKPEELGLNLEPDVVENTDCSIGPEGTKGVTIWGAMRWWWTQKTPCDEIHDIEQG